MSTALDYHKSLIALLDKAEKLTVDSTYLSMNENEEVEKGLTHMGIVKDQTAHAFRFLLSSFRTKIFLSKKGFLEYSGLKNESNILIYDRGNVLCFIEGQTYLNNTPQTSNYFFVNTFAYLKFEAFLKEQEKEIDNSLHFVDSFNRTARKIVLVSLAEKGRLTIEYEKEIPQFIETVDLSVGLSTFIKCFDEPTKNLVKFLKVALIKHASDIPKDVRFASIFKNLSTIVEKAKLNFDVYLNNLSIDKIKKDYSEIKSKFFKDLSDILGKLTQQVIALPIAFSASLLAVDKITENVFYLWFIAIALSGTSVYLCYLLRLQFQDLRQIKKVFEFDYNLIIENNFFLDHENEKDFFKDVKLQFEGRVLVLEKIAEVYFWALNIANLAIIDYILTIKHVPTTGIVLVSFAILLATTLFRNQVIDPKR